MKSSIGPCLSVALLVAVPASAADATTPSKPREGRGFVLGMGFGAARVGFGGAEDLALVIGGPTGTLTFPSGGGTIEVRPLDRGRPGVRRASLWLFRLGGP